VTIEATTTTGRAIMTVAEQSNSPRNEKRPSGVVPAHKRPSSSENDQWWLFVSLVLMAVGAYVLLAVHLILDAIHASALIWAAGFALTAAFFIGAGFALGKHAGFTFREQVEASPALLLGSEPFGSRPEETPAETRERRQRARAAEA
jgi:hypothetical protein